MVRSLVLNVMFIFIPCLVWGSGTHIGNGDDGIDLEKSEKVQSGILIETRKKAVELLQKFDLVITNVDIKNRIKHLKLP